MEKVNYILHLNQAFEKFCDDPRLTPYHISLYFALFQYWNLAKFHNPISVNREELMRASRIGSVNTYIKAMKELDAWAYLQYKPSYNPLRGSLVHLYNFNKTQSNAHNISHSKGSDKAAEKGHSNADVTVLLPSKNNSNSKNKTNKKETYGKHIKKIPFSKRMDKDSKRSYDNSNSRRRKTSHSAAETFPSQGRKNRNTVQEGTPPSLTEVKIYFVQKKFPLLEAEKFYNYFESNGWLVGGRAPMRNWKAAARNWILNSNKFSPSPVGEGSRARVMGLKAKTRESVAKSSIDKLNATTDKNYNESL
jgi:hypothetical protein